MFIQATYQTRLVFFEIPDGDLGKFLYAPPETITVFEDFGGDIQMFDVPAADLSNIQKE